MKRERLLFVDWLKTIALFGMIVAHIGAPNWILQIRNFDVILMVICSGLLAGYSRKNSRTSIKSYFYKRILRLIVPTYLFLIFYFILSYMIGHSQSKNVILDTFLFQQTGIGYTWIILVYIICLMGTPLIEHLKPGILSFVLLVLLLIIQEWFCSLSFLVQSTYISSVVLYIIPYLSCFWIGFYFNSFKREILYLIAVFFATAFLLQVCILFCYNNIFVLINNYKYPPRLYYVSYGVFSSILIMMIGKKICPKQQEPKIISFISSSTLWIYLWHIMIVKIIEHTANGLFWILKLIIVISISIGITYLQNIIVNIIDKKIPRASIITRYLKG